jgi:hypothetical protein
MSRADSCAGSIVRISVLAQRARCADRLASSTRAARPIAQLWRRRDRGSRTKYRARSAELRKMRSVAVVSWLDLLRNGAGCEVEADYGIP